MRRGRVVLGLAVAATVSAAVALAAPGHADAGGSGLRASGSLGIEARASLAPRISLFGDTVEALVDVTLDRSRIDPESVRVDAAFLPWKVTAKPVQARHDAGSTTHLRTTFVLRCVTEDCVPSGRTAPIQFEPAQVSYADGGGGGPGSLQARWPVLLVYSRSSTASFDGRQAGENPWRADLVSFSPPSYRIAPGLLIALLLAGCTVLAGAGGTLAFIAWPRRVPPPPAEPEPEPEPLLSPLEQALALLEESVRVDGTAAQRRALELVAEELELAEWGDPSLARSARALAWSEAAPPVTDTTALAARVRSALDENGRRNGNGHVD